MADDKDIEYRLAIKDLAAKTLERIEESIAQVDKRMLAMGKSAGASTRAAAAGADHARDSLDKLGPATGLVARGFQEIGATGASELTRVAAHLTHVAEGGGALAAVMAAVGLTFLAVSKTAEALRASNENAIEGAASAAKRQRDEYKKLDEESRQYATAAAARARGVTVEEEKLRKSIANARVEYEAATRTVDRLEARAVSDKTNASWFDVDFDGEQELLSKSMGAQRAARDAMAQGEQRLVEVTKEAARVRAEAWEREATAKAVAAQRFTQAALAEAASTDAETKAIGEGLSGLSLQLAKIDTERRAAVDRYRSEQMDAIDDAERREIEAANHVAEAIAAIKRRYAELRITSPVSAEMKAAIAAIDAKFLARGAGAKASAGALSDADSRSLLLQEQELQSQLVEIAESGRVDRRAVLERQERDAVDLAILEGRSVEKVNKDFSLKLLAFDIDVAQRRADAKVTAIRFAQDAEAAAGEALASAGRDPRDAILRRTAEMLSAASAESRRFERLREDAQKNQTWTPEREAAELRAHNAVLTSIETGHDADVKSLRDSTNLDITRATEDFLRQIEDLHRSAYDQERAEEQSRFTRALEDAKLNGASREKLEAEHVARMRLIQERASGVGAGRAEIARQEREVLDNPNASFGEGFTARMNTVHSELRSAAELGADAGSVIADSFTKGAVEAAQGMRSIKDAALDMARGVIQSLQQIAAQQAALYIVGTLFGGVARTASVTTPAGARAAGVDTAIPFSNAPGAAKRSMVVNYNTTIQAVDADSVKRLIMSNRDVVRAINHDDMTRHAPTRELHRAVAQGR